MIVTLSSVALPGTNGFIGEFLILLGAWKASPGLTTIASLGAIFGAVYMLWMFQRVMFGPVTHEENKKLKDLSWREITVLAPLIVAIFAMGIFPNFFFDKLTPSINRFLERSGGVSITTGTAITQLDSKLHPVLGRAVASAKGNQ
jgi:NADH-quinone oxidoreductase subunit M